MVIDFACFDPYLSMLSSLQTHCLCSASIHTAIEAYHEGDRKATDRFSAVRGTVQTTEPYKNVSATIVHKYTNAILISVTYALVVGGV